MKLNKLLLLMLLGSSSVLVGFWLGQASSVENFTSKIPNLFYESSAQHGAVQLKKVASLNSSNPAYALQEAFNQIAANAVRAVVSIQVVSKATAPSNYSDGNEFLRRFFGLPENEAPTRKVELFGSGFLINENGYLISNYHVVKDALEIKILFKDLKKEYDAEIVGTDPDTDIALLKIKGKEKFPFLTLANSDEIRVGDMVVAIGNPFGLSQTFTTGVVSAKGRTGIIGNRYENWIQTDVAINEGNSGGPLLNLNGEVIGINSAIFSKGAGSIGISFSIPINMVKNIIDQLKSKGKVERGRLGIYFKELDTELAEALEIEEGGVIVNGIVENSSASKVNIQIGDVIVAYRGKKIRSGADLTREVGNTPLEEQVDLTIIRDGKKISVKVTIKKESQKLATAQPSAKSSSYLGIVVGNLSAEQSGSLGLNENLGVQVIALDQSSPYLNKGGGIGDIILSINKKNIRSIKDFETVMKKVGKGQKLLFKIQKGKYIDFLVILAK